jgi:hypothetical protein
LTYRKVGQPVNQAPTVQMTAPENDASFDAGTPVLLRAQAADSDGTIDSVEFFADSQSLGNGVVAADGSFEQTWIPSAGRFSLAPARPTKKGVHLQPGFRYHPATFRQRSGSERRIRSELLLEKR